MSELIAGLVYFVVVLALGNWLNRPVLAFHWWQRWWGLLSGLAFLVALVLLGTLVMLLLAPPKGD